MLKPFPMNLDREDVRACGRVAVWSSMLDTTMEVSIWVLTPLPRANARKMTLTWQNADTKRWKLEDLANSSARPTPNQRLQLKAILSEIKAALDDRNRVIHALWHIGRDGTPWAAKYDRAGKLIFHDRLDKNFVHPIAQRNKDLAKRLAEWNEELEPGVMSSYYPPI